MNYISPFGAVLPNQQQNPLDFYLQQKQVQEQRDFQQRQLKLQQERFADQQIADMMDKMDFKHLATGTVYDPIIQNNLTSLAKQATDTIKGGDVLGARMKVMNGINDLRVFAEKIKGIRAKTEEGAKAFEKDQSIDSARLARLALGKALFQYDAKGNTVGLKDPYDLDDTADYISEIIDNTPEEVTKGLGSFYRQIEKGKYIPYKGETVRDINGTKRVQAYEGRYDPQYNELVNSKGEPVDDNTATGIRVKSIPLSIAGQTLSGVPDEVRDYFFQDRGTKAAIRAEARRMLRVLPPDTKQEDVERFILHRELSNSANSYINKTKDTVDTSQLESQLFRREMRNLSSSLRSGDKKENFIDVIQRLKDGDQNYYGEPYTEDDAPAEGLVDVSKSFPGGSLYGMNSPNKNGVGLTKAEYNRILFQPQTKQFFIKKGADDDFEPIQSTSNWVKEIAPLNGMTKKEAIEKAKFDPNEEALQELQKTMKKKKGISALFKIPLPKIFK